MVSSKSLAFNFAMKCPSVVAMVPNLRIYLASSTEKEVVPGILRPTTARTLGLAPVHSSTK